MLATRIPFVSLALGFFILITYYFGHLALIQPLLIVLAGIVSFFLARKVLPQNEKPLETAHRKWFILIVATIAILLFLSMSDGIFANTCSDINNHARSIRLGAFTQTIFTNDLDMNPALSPNLPLHEAPILGLGVYMGLNSIFISTYPVISLFSALLIMLSVLGIFFLAREWFGEKVGLISLFLAGFSIVNFFLLSHGFIPQIVGSFAAVWAAYFLFQKKIFPAAIMSAASMAYPPLFLVILVLVFFRLVINWRAKMILESVSDVKIILLAILLTLPEILELGLGRLPTFLSHGGIELIRGGIAVPNPLLLLAFIPSIIGLLILAREKKLTHPAVLFFAAVGVGIGYVAGAFLINLLTHTVSIQIHRLYMAVKFFYFALWPLSILAAVGFVHVWKSKHAWGKPVVALLLALHLILFAGFLFSLPQPRENFPTEIYALSDKISTLPGPFFIGIDTNLLVNEYSAPFPYAPFVDNPDNGSGKCPKVEINRMFEFPWARHELDWDDAYFRAVDDQNNWIVKYGSLDVNYFVTEQLLSYPIVFAQGKYFVYRISPPPNESVSP